MYTVGSLSLPNTLDVARLAHSIWLEQSCPKDRALDNWLEAEHKLTAELAYQLWLEQGCPEGCALRNWLEAEREVRVLRRAYEIWERERFQPLTGPVVEHWVRAERELSREAA
jgi:hypothetical protein